MTRTGRINNSACFPVTPWTPVSPLSTLKGFLLSLAAHTALAGRAFCWDGSREKSWGSACWSRLRGRVPRTFHFPTAFSTSWDLSPLSTFSSFRNPVLSLWQCLEVVWGENLQLGKPKLSLTLPHVSDHGTLQALPNFIKRVESFALFTQDNLLLPPLEMWE